MPGLDPGIHSVTVSDNRRRDGMDCRVKPGNDDICEWWIAILSPPGLLLNFVTAADVIERPL
jgi:hypothetical protein